MVRIAKVFDFDAAHWLPNVPDGHKCKRMHGHTCKVELVLEGELDERGFLVDFAEIAEAWEPVGSLVDHRCLNDIEQIPEMRNPTAENLVSWMFATLSRSLPALVSMRLYESSTTWAEVHK
jgi:6-pyruvoyltetrahydropterin/6-carboxytetrahydropterin synthase